METVSNPIARVYFTEQQICTVIFKNGAWVTYSAYYPISIQKAVAKAIKKWWKCKQDQDLYAQKALQMYMGSLSEDA